MIGGKSAGRAIANLCKKRIDIVPRKREISARMETQSEAPQPVPAKGRTLPVKAIVAALAIVGVAVIAAMMVQTSVTRASICVHTASREGYTEHIGGRKSDEWSTPSALETYLKGRQVPVEHRWVSYAGTGRNIFGRTMSRSHGDPGAIMDLRNEVLEKWIATQSHEEIMALYEMLKSGDQEAIRAGIAGIFDKYYETQPGG